MNLKVKETWRNLLAMTSTPEKKRFKTKSMLFRETLQQHFVKPNGSYTQNQSKFSERYILSNREHLW